MGEVTVNSQTGKFDHKLKQAPSSDISVVNDSFTFKVIDNNGKESVPATIFINYNIDTPTTQTNTPLIVNH